MFSMLGLGGDSSGVEWTVEADSPTEPGKKSLVTGPIEAFDAAKFKEMFWKWVQDQPATNQYQTGREVDGAAGVAMTEKTSFEVSGLASLLVTFKGDFYTKYKAEGDDLVILRYLADASMQTVSGKTVIKLLKDPFRLEVYVQEEASRRAGPVLAGLLENDLKTIGFDSASVQSEQDSPSSPGSKSVVSNEIGITIEQYWQKIKEASSGEEQSDGSCVIKSAGWFGGASSVIVLSYDKSQDAVVGLDYQTDESMQKVFATSYTKITNGKAERWAIGTESRNAGEGEKVFLDGMITQMQNV